MDHRVWMRRYFGWRGLCGSLALSGVAAPGLAQEPVSAFLHVAVIPMDRERVLTDQTVVVRGGHIVALGPAGRVTVPVGARRIDGRGKYLIPSLADMHAHVLPEPGGEPSSIDSYLGAQYSPTALSVGKRELSLYVANGVTTVRVMRGRLATLDLRAQAASGVILSPRMYVAADPIVMVIPSFAHGASKPEIEINQLDSAVRYVAAVKRAGFDFLKMYEDESRGVDSVAYDSAIAVAHRIRLPIAGHPPPPGIDSVDSIDRAIREGFASVEHLLGLEVKDETKLHATALKLKQAGVWVCPTLLHVNSGTRLAQVYPELRYLRESVRLAIIPMIEQPQHPDDLAAAQVRRKVVKMLHDVGVGLLLGTDAGSGQIWGFSVHRELEELVAAGLSPYDALVTGTRNPAAYFGTLDSTGTIAVGKRADLVLLSGNPLENIRHTAQPAGVMLGGRWLPRRELDQILTLVEGTLDLR